MTTTIGGSYPAVNSDSDATINGLTVGKGGGAVSTNTAVGLTALTSNSTGAELTAVGYQSLYTNTGNYNSAFGAYALYFNTSGASNTAVGNSSLYRNTTGTSNSALGNGSLVNTTTGSYNVAVGNSALSSNTTASNNTAIGYQAGYSNTSSSSNTLFGAYAGFSLSTLGNNAMFGYQTGFNATGYGSSFFGINSSSGKGAGYAITSGNNNTILGGYSGNQGGLDIRTASNYIVLSDGDGNPRVIVNNKGAVGIGQNPSTSWTDFYALTVGQNTAIWSQAGTNGTSYYSNNLYYDGSGRKYTANGYASEIQFDSNGQIKTFTAASGTAGNTVSLIAGPYLANSGTSWTNSSDERLKNITGEISNALEKVGQLRAAEYTWKSDEFAKPQVGLIAQDLQKVLPEVVVIPNEEFDEMGNKQYLGVNYDGVIPLLVAAIQELKAEVDSLKQQLGK